jgi:hypothetical protein
MLVLLKSFVVVVLEIDDMVVRVLEDLRATHIAVPNSSFPLFVGTAQVGHQFKHDVQTRSVQQEQIQASSFV